MFHDTMQSPALCNVQQSSGLLPPRSSEGLAGCNFLSFPMGAPAGSEPTGQPGAVGPPARPRLGEARSFLTRTPPNFPGPINQAAVWPSRGSDKPTPLYLFPRTELVRGSSQVCILKSPTTSAKLQPPSFSCSVTTLLQHLQQTNKIFLPFPTKL